MRLIRRILNDTQEQYLVFLFRFEIDSAEAFVVGVTNVPDCSCGHVQAESRFRKSERGYEFNIKII